MEVKDLTIALDDLATKLDLATSDLNSKTAEMAELQHEVAKLKEAASAVSRDSHKAMQAMKNTILENLNDISTQIYTAAVGFVPALAVSYTSK